MSTPIARADGEGSNVTASRSASRNITVGSSRTDIPPGALGIRGGGYVLPRRSGHPSRAPRMRSNSLPSESLHLERLGVEYGLDDRGILGGDPNERNPRAPSREDWPGQEHMDGQTDEVDQPFMGRRVRFPEGLLSPPPTRRRLGHRRRGAQGDDGSAQPSGNLVPPEFSDSDGDVEVDNTFPIGHLALLPTAAVPAFRADQALAGRRYSKDLQIPGVNKTLFIYADSAEVWKEITQVSVVAVLPRNRLLKLIVILVLNSPVVAPLVCVTLAAVFVQVTISYMPTRIILVFASIPVNAVVKLVVYYSVYISYIVATTIWNAVRTGYGAVNHAINNQILALLHITFEYLEEIRDAEAARRGVL